MVPKACLTLLSKNPILLSVVKKDTINNNWYHDF